MLALPFPIDPLELAEGLACDEVPLGRSVVAVFGDLSFLATEPSFSSFSLILSAYDPSALNTDVEEEGEGSVLPLGREADLAMLCLG